MRSLSSLRQGHLFSATCLLRQYGALNHASELPRTSSGFSGNLENGKCRFFSLLNITRAESAKEMQPRVMGNSGMELCPPTARGRMYAPHALGFRSCIHSTSQKDIEIGRNSKPMDFVRGVLEEDDKIFEGSSRHTRYNEQNADFVHIKILRNNTFVTVTDSKGNKKLGASTGCLPELKGGGPKISKYASEATCEHVGRLARDFGLKSVVMRVNGFTYFKKKRQAIMSFREGFGTRRDQNPVMHVEDTTRKPHNGCRLRKKRRI